MELTVQTMSVDTIKDLRIYSLFGATNLKECFKDLFLYDYLAIPYGYKFCIKVRGHVYPMEDLGTNFIWSFVM